MNERWNNIIEMPQLNNVLISLRDDIRVRNSCNDYRIHIFQ